MKKKRFVNPPPRQEVIRIRYGQFLAVQSRILKNSKEICEQKIKDLRSTDPKIS